MSRLKQRAARQRQAVANGHVFHARHVERLTDGAVNGGERRAKVAPMGRNLSPDAYVDAKDTAVAMRPYGTGGFNRQAWRPTKNSAETAE